MTTRTGEAGGRRTGTTTGEGIGGERGDTGDRLVLAEGEKLGGRYSRKGAGGWEGVKHLGTLHVGVSRESFDLDLRTSQLSREGLTV